MTALEVTCLFSEIMGLLGGIFSFATFFNFLIRKKTHSNSIKQRSLSVMLSTLLYASLPIWVSGLTDSYDIAGKIIFAFLCGGFVYRLMNKGVTLGRFLLFQLFGFLGFIVLGCLSMFLLGNNYHSAIGTLVFILSFFLSWFFIYKKNVLKAG